MLISTFVSYKCRPNIKRNQIVCKYENKRKQASKKSEHNLSGYQMLYLKIKEYKPKYVFCISGGPIMPLIDQFHDDCTTQMIVPTNEQSMMYMMKGYSAKSEEYSFGMVTSGPGITNCITGLMDAKQDGVPLMLISGQVETSRIGSDAFQECDAVGLSQYVTKMSYQIKHPNEIVHVFDHLMAIANTDRKGPVHLDIPKDCLQQNITSSINVALSFTNSQLNTNQLNTNHSITSINNIHFIAELISKSEKPLIIAGQGALSAGYLINHLVDVYQIPITTTLHAIGIYDESKPLSLKMHGMHGTIYANKAIQNSDCIIAIGNRFDDRTIGNLDSYAPFAMQAFKERRGGIIHCNIDPNVFHKTIEQSYFFQLESKKFVRELLMYMKLKNRDKWLKKISYWKEMYPIRYQAMKNNKLTTQHVLKYVDHYIHHCYLYKDVYFTTGVGNHQMMTCQLLTHRFPNRVLMSGGFGVMGVGLPYAIGLQLSHPNKIIIDLDGDSSFNMTSHELKTISQYNLPIKIIIFNDQSQSMVRTWEEKFYDNHITATTNYVNPVYSKFSSIYPNIKSIQCNSNSTIFQSLNTLINYPGPIICEFIVESTHCYPFVKPNEPLDSNFYHDVYD